MRILLDESLPREMKRELPGHQVQTVVECGWSGVKNGQLLKIAAKRFDVFCTADQNIPFQQNHRTLPISIVVLVALNNRLDTLRPLFPKLLSTLNQLPPRSIVQIG